MIFDLGAAIGRLLGVALPSALGLQTGLQDLAAVSVEQTAVFRSISAEVANWRLEATTHLEMPMKARVLVILGATVSRMPRCVKLNNYWCIKRAGWHGELGADPEGHVAFDTAETGARAAAILLRRYYVEFNRRSALAIVSRWAPNRCLGAAALPSDGIAPRAPPLVLWQQMSREQRERTFDQLLTNRRRLAEARYRRTIQAIAAAKRMQALPRPRPGSPGRLATTSAQAPDRFSNKTVPFKTAISPSKHKIANAPISCALEIARITSYARRAIDGIAATPSQDLELFDKEGAPTWRLSRLMMNMASVEIGPHKIGHTLVPAALAAMNATVDPRALGARPPAEPAGQSGNLPPEGPEKPPS